MGVASLECGELRSDWRPCVIVIAVAPAVRLLQERLLVHRVPLNWWISNCVVMHFGHRWAFGLFADSPPCHHTKPQRALGHLCECCPSDGCAFAAIGFTGDAKPAWYLANVTASITPVTPHSTLPKASSLIVVGHDRTPYLAANSVSGESSQPKSITWMGRSAPGPMRFCQYLNSPPTAIPLSSSICSPSLRHGGQLSGSVKISSLGR